MGGDYYIIGTSLRSDGLWDHYLFVSGMNTVLVLVTVLVRVGFNI